MLKHKKIILCKFKSKQLRKGKVRASVADPDKLNLDQDPAFLKFLIFLLLLPPWIRIPNLDSDPQARLNSDPIRIPNTG